MNNSYLSRPHTWTKGGEKRWRHATISLNCAASKGGGAYTIGTESGGRHTPPSNWRSNNPIEIRSGYCRHCQEMGQLDQKQMPNWHDQLCASNFGWRSTNSNRMRKRSIWWGIRKIIKISKADNSPKVSGSVVAFICQQIWAASARCLRPNNRHRHNYFSSTRTKSPKIDGRMSLTPSLFAN